MDSIAYNVPSIYDVATEESNVPKDKGVSPQRICCVRRCNADMYFILLFASKSIITNGFTCCNRTGSAVFKTNFFT